MTYKLYLGDCFEIFPTLDVGSIDAIITDLPYGTTACKWDTVIPFESMWKEVKRVLKPNGVFVTTASQPFTSALIMSNIDNYKHSWVWDKNRGNGHLIAKYRPLQQTEDVVVFCDGSHVYNPQMRKRKKPRKFGGSPSETSLCNKQNFKDTFTRVDYTENYPTNLLEISWSIRNGLHPTQKPVALYEYLIRTYTNEGDTVLDICMGSGTTIVAAIRTGRNAIGIEKDTEFGYMEIAEKRCKEATLQPELFSSSKPLETQQDLL